MVVPRKFDNLPDGVLTVFRKESGGGGVKRVRSNYRNGDCFHYKGNIYSFDSTVKEWKLKKKVRVRRPSVKGEPIRVHRKRTSKVRTTVPRLREICKREGVKGYTRLSKKEMVKKCAPFSVKDLK